MNQPPSANSQASAPSVPTPSELEQDFAADEIATHSQSQAPRQPWSLSAKVTAWAIAATTIPLILLGSVAYWTAQPQPTASGSSQSVADVRSQYGLNLFLSTAGLGIASGAIATVLARRTIQPILKAANTSSSIVNRLRRGNLNDQDRSQEPDERKVLLQNLSALEEQMPYLVTQQESEAEQVRLLMTITHRLRESLSQEEVLRVAATEIRKTFRADRVAVFRFDSAEDGTIVEESAAPGLPKMLWTTLGDPCLADYLEQYRQGRIRAIDNIHNAGLDDCHIGLLDRFAVKANLIAPLIKNNQLFGLLIVNQCSGPRYWQRSEIDLIAQLSTQVSFALDHANLLEQVDNKASQSHVFIELARRIRASLNEEDILKTTVEEVRKALATDRVIIFSFDAHWYGTVVAESVVPGMPKALWANIKDPCFEEDYVEQYQAGRVQATNNIFEAGLTACHLKQLEPFAVKANLVAPILKDDHLFALLIAHECSSPRNWQQTEIDLVAQLATQVGYALDHARVLAQVDTRAEQAQVFIEISRHIREFLNEEDILKTTVEQVRKVLRTDRAVVYTFNSDWGGSIVAESVLPGWPRALDYKIEDACIPEEMRAAYLVGRVVPTPNVSAAGFHRDHLTLMERLKIQANLVAPILHNGHLFGLLIVHQCSGPRDWQQAEIDLLAQIATQVGFALDHARVLDHVEHAYQIAEASSEQQRLQKEFLQHQVADWMEHSGPTVKALSNDLMQQMESITTIYQQMKELSTETQQIQSLLAQSDSQSQSIQSLLDAHSETELSQDLAQMQTRLGEANQLLQQLSQPTQKVELVSAQMSQIVSQLKLQAMNAALEATRIGSAAPEFASIGEKVLELARQLDTNATELTAWIGSVRSQLSTLGLALQHEIQQVQGTYTFAAQTEQTLEQMGLSQRDRQSWTQTVSQASQRQSQAITSANQLILEIATRANQSSEQAMGLVQTLDQLVASSREAESNT